MEKLCNVVICLTGLGASQVANSIPENTTPQEVLKVVVQIVILIATLIGLFKKKSK
jgi:hypothetical protein